MKRLPLLFILLAAFASPAQAGPHPISWLKEHPAVGRIVLYTAAGVSTFESARQTNLCRERVDIARCFGGYGEVGARQITNGIFTGGMIALSEFGYHKHFREWFLPVAAVTTYNGITAYQQSQISQIGRKPDGERQFRYVPR